MKKLVSVILWMVMMCVGNTVYATENTISNEVVFNESVEVTDDYKSYILENKENITLYVSSNIEHLTIKNSENIQVYGLKGTQVTLVNSTNCYFNMITLTRGNTAINVTNSNHITFANLTLEYVDYGITSTNSTDIVVSNVTMYDNTQLVNPMCTSTDITIYTM